MYGSTETNAFRTSDLAVARIGQLDLGELEVGGDRGAARPARAGSRGSASARRDPTPFASPACTDRQSAVRPRLRAALRNLSTPLLACRAARGQQGTGERLAIPERTLAVVAEGSSMRRITMILTALVLVSAAGLILVAGRPRGRLRRRAVRDRWRQLPVPACDRRRVVRAATSSSRSRGRTARVRVTSGASRRALRLATRASSAARRRRPGATLLSHGVVEQHGPCVSQSPPTGSSRSTSTRQASA